MYKSEVFVYLCRFTKKQNYLTGVVLHIDLSFTWCFVLLCYELDFANYNKTSYL